MPLTVTDYSGGRNKALLLKDLLASLILSHPISSIDCINITCMGNNSLSCLEIVFPFQRWLFVTLWVFICLDATFQLITQYKDLTPFLLILIKNPLFNSSIKEL